MSIRVLELHFQITRSTHIPCPLQSYALNTRLQVTGFGYEHDEAWSANMELFKELTDVSRGVRRLGAAAIDLCHVALGIHLLPHYPGLSMMACEIH